MLKVNQQSTHTHTHTHTHTQFSYGCMMLTLFMAIDLSIIVLYYAHKTTLPPPYIQPENHSTLQVCVISAVDYNQLTFFVAANLLTGLVNFSIDTLRASVPVSLAVLMLYMVALVFVFVALHKLRIKIKL